jgi:hypothetical protein
MAAAPKTDDDKALAVIIDFLSYAERELRLLNSPMPDTADLIGLAARSVERKFGLAEIRTP